MGCGERMQEDVGDQRRASTHCWQCIEPRGPVRGTAIGGCRASPSPPNPRASCEGRTAAEPKQGCNSGIAIRSELGCEGGRDVLFFTLTPFCCPRGPSAGRPKPGPDYAGMSGHAASKRRRGRCFGEKVTEERRISVDIGCTRKRQGKEAGREGADSGKGEQGGPPKHVSRYACTL